MLLVITKVRLEIIQLSIDECFREFQPLLDFAAGKTGNYLYTSPVSGKQISLDYQIVNNR